MPPKPQKRQRQSFLSSYFASKGEEKVTDQEVIVVDLSDSDDEEKIGKGEETNKKQKKVKLSSSTPLSPSSYISIDVGEVKEREKTVLDLNKVEERLLQCTSTPEQHERFSRAVLSHTKGRGGRSSHNDHLLGPIATSVLSDIKEGDEGSRETSGHNMSKDEANEMEEKERVGEDEEEEEEDDDEGRWIRRGPNVSYTPLERQVLKLKEENPGCILFVENGYKYSLYGRDAFIVAKLLDIYASMRKNFLTCSIPTHRLHVHAKRVVESGYKVGVVRQVETAALKKAKGSAGPFQRKLCEVYTKATFSFPEEDTQECGWDGTPGMTSNVSQAATPFSLSLGSASSASSSSSLSVPLSQQSTQLAPSLSQHSFASSSLSLSPEVSSKYLLFLFETTPSSSSSDEVYYAQSVSVTLIAVDALNGDVVWDMFSDSVIRTELESRLSHLEPLEILLPPRSLLSHTSADLIQAYTKTSVPKERQPRVEILKERDYPFEKGAAARKISLFYGQRERERVREKVLSLPPSVQRLLAVVITHLEIFQLANIMTVDTVIRSYLDGVSTSMHLDGRTMENLSLSRDKGMDASSLTHNKPSCLLHLFSHTSTAAGGRLMRRWVTTPLTVRSDIEYRLAAVTELVDSYGFVWFQQLRALLSHCPDIERGLSKSMSRTICPSDFYLMVNTFYSIASSVLSSSLSSSVSSGLLTELCDPAKFTAVQQISCRLKGMLFEE